MQLKDILQQAIDNNSFVELSLSNGQHLKAKVKAIYGELVIFHQMPGREFFQSYIPYQHIVFVEVRVG